MNEATENFEEESEKKTQTIDTNLKFVDVWALGTLEGSSLW